jgi:hypothetical protein
MADLTELLLEVKDNTSQLLERWTTQSDKWDQEVQEAAAKVDSFIASAKATIKGWWYPKFYVHQQSGNDSNEGLQSSPIKSIQEAIDRTPEGGACTIVLLSEYTCESITTGKNQTIVIVGDTLDGDGNPIRTLRNDTSNPSSKIFVDSGTNLICKRLILEANNNGNSASHWSTLFKISQSSGTGIYIGEWGSSKTTKIVLNHPLLNIESAITLFAMRYCEIVAPNPQNLITKWGAGHFLFAAENVVADSTVTLPNTGWN